MFYFLLGSIVFRLSCCDAHWHLSLFQWRVSSRVIFAFDWNCIVLKQKIMPSVAKMALSSPFCFSHFWSCWVTHDKYFAQRISKVSQIFAKVCPVLKNPSVLIQRFVTDSWNSLVQPSGKISDVVEPRSENWK